MNGTGLWASHNSTFACQFTAYSKLLFSIAEVQFAKFLTVETQGYTARPLHKHLQDIWVKRSLCLTEGGIPISPIWTQPSSGLLNSPKTKMSNGIMLVVFPYPFVQVSLWRCNLETTDWIVVPGAWVPNPPNADGRTPVAFWGLRFGKFKALLCKPRHQHLLVGDPLNSVGY